MSEPVAIEVRDLWKSFAIPTERHDTLKERAVHPSRWLRGETRELVALRGITFDVARGEFFGVIGRNGSGKSTLLKLLASIYAFDAGSVRVAGRLAPFIELGVGFNQELNARDNVVLNGVMMGLSPAEARLRYDAVMDYAELWDYTELKLKNYSSGMQVRLGFSLMLQVDADVLLVDEVLAVGDAAFKDKCNRSLEEMKDRGTTIVLVTHDMGAIRERCDRALLIEDGQIELLGDPRTVADRYMEVLFTPSVESERDGDSTGGRVTAIQVVDGAGKPVEAVAQGEPFGVDVTIRAEERLPRLELVVELVNNPEGVRVAAIVVGEDAELALAAGEEATIQVRFENPLGAGHYRFNYRLGLREGEELRVLDSSVKPTRLTVLGTDADRGVVNLGHRVAVDRGSRRTSGREGS